MKDQQGKPNRALFQLRLQLRCWVNVQEPASLALHTSNVAKIRTKMILQRSSPEVSILMIMKKKSSGEGKQQTQSVLGKLRLRPFRQKRYFLRLRVKFILQILKRACSGFFLVQRPNAKALVRLGTFFLLNQNQFIYVRSSHRSNHRNQRAHEDISSAGKSTKRLRLSCMVKDCMVSRGFFLFQTKDFMEAS